MNKCDFCGKAQNEVERMITGGHGTAICNYCVLVCMEILIQEVKDNKEIAFPTSSQAEKESTLGKEDKN